MGLNPQITSGKLSVKPDTHYDGYRVYKDGTPVTRTFDITHITSLPKDWAQHVWTVTPLVVSEGVKEQVWPVAVGTTPHYGDGQYGQNKFSGDV